MRRLGQLAGGDRVFAAAVVAAVVIGALISGRASALLEALARAAHADWRLVVAAVTFEALHVRLAPNSFSVLCRLPRLAGSAA
jgi:hypothetical protein